MPAPEFRIRFARVRERAALERLQLRASLVWDEYRAALLAHPDAIEVPERLLRERRVRVVELGAEIVGFSQVLKARRGVVELDGLFVEPAHMGTGLGRRLVIDAAQRADRDGAHTMEVTANPRAEGFYLKAGFVITGRAETRFGPALRMRLRVGLHSLPGTAAPRGPFKDE
jgi:GNAT superfamily N-acetyltransferase